MVQASQVTAAQVLDAGRRAEADGRVEYAIQFYRHLADHHAAAPEAAAARDALSRLDLRRSANPAERQAARPASRPAPAPARRAAPPSSAPHLPGRTSIRIAPAGSPEPHAPPIIAAPSGGYLVGRVIAHALAGLGALLVLSGIAVIVFGVMAGPDASLPRGLAIASLGPYPGLGMTATGVLLVLWSQIARAVFDIARSSRDLAVIERAKAERLNERRR